MTLKTFIRLMKNNHTAGNVCFFKRIDETIGHQIDLQLEKE